MKKMLLIAAIAPQWEGPQGIDAAQVQALRQLAKNDRPNMAEYLIHTQFWAKPQSKALENWLIQMALSTSGLATRHCLEALIQEDGKKDLNAVKVPVFLLQGDQDKMAPPSLGSFLQEKIEGAQLEFFKEAGHGILYEQREILNQRLLEILSI